MYTEMRTNYRQARLHADCEFCANDSEQCHHSMDCEREAGPTGYCSVHLGWHRPFTHAYVHPGPQDCRNYAECHARAYGIAFDRDKGV